MPDLNITILSDSAKIALQAAKRATDAAATVEGGVAAVEEAGVEQLGNIADAGDALLTAVTDIAESVASYREQFADTIDYATLAASQVRALEAIRAQDPNFWVDNRPVRGVDSPGRGTRDYTAFRTLEYALTQANVPTNAATIRVRNGQRHFLEHSDRENRYIGSQTKPCNFVGYGDGNYPAFLETRLPISQRQAWVNVSGTDSYKATITLRGTLNFSGTPSIAAVHMAMAEIVDDTVDPFGLAYEWKTGGANPAANEAAVIASSGGAFTFKYTGQTAGEIRGTGHVGDTFEFLVRTPNGTSPADKDILIPDWATGPVFHMNAGGIISTVGTCSKDTWQTNGINGALPTIEGAKVETHGHGTVYPVKVLGRVEATGRVNPGEPTYSIGQTGGYVWNMFTGGRITRDEPIITGSIKGKNFLTGPSMHGAGVTNEGCKLWDIFGDIELNNCGSAWEVYGALLTKGGRQRKGRVLCTEMTGGFIAYGTPIMTIAPDGGIFEPKAQSSPVMMQVGLTTLLVVMGSTNPGERYKLDASKLSNGAPYYDRLTLIRRLDETGDPPIVITQNTDDVTPVGHVPVQLTRDPVPGYYPAPNYVHKYFINCNFRRDLFGGLTSTARFATLHVDSLSSINLGNRTWAQIISFMGGSSNCFIEPGARAYKDDGTFDTYA